jgi:hypothetical protein
MNTNVHVLGERDRPPWTEEADHGRRQLLLLLSAVAGAKLASRNPLQRVLERIQPRCSRLDVP